jgi:hypothetical protein
MPTRLPDNQVNKINALVRKATSGNTNDALAAQAEIVAELTLPLRQGVLMGSTISAIFTEENFLPGQDIVYPIDFFSGTDSKEWKAYHIPDQGRLPERMIGGDEVRVATYDIGNTIDAPLKYLRNARFDVLGRMLAVLEAGFVQKINDDAWHLILRAGLARGVVVNDAAASAGQFTKRLVALMKTYMRRNSGGNAMSLGRGRLTHLFVSPEALEDMREWTDIDDTTRREIYLSSDEGGQEVYQTMILPLDELGVGQDYQNYWDDTLGGTMGSSDVEIVIGIDASQNDAFVMPVREQLEVHEDDTAMRARRFGFFGWTERGAAILDNNNVLIGSI